MPTLSARPRKDLGKRNLLVGLFLGFLALALLFGVISRLDLSLDFSSMEIVSPLGGKNAQNLLEENLSQYQLEGKNWTIEKEKIFVVIDQTEVFFSPKRDFKVQVATLQFILTRAKMEGRKPAQVDLRFDKPVVRYQ